MKHLRLGLTLAVLLGLFSCFATAVGEAQEFTAEIKAEAALLLEVNSGQIIWENNIDEKLYPASLTKIMSMLLALEQIEQGIFSLDEQVYVSARASSMGGSELFLSEGDLLSLEELLIGMAVGSGNDAAVALAEHVGGSVEGFAELMNDKARELGMDSTNFTNPHGLHNPEHYTTAYDVMLMSLAILEYPEIHKWATIWMDEHFLQGKIKSGEVYLSNTNRMVQYYPGCDGLKTGYTKEAGNSISATAQRSQTRFLAVVMGSPSVDERYDAARLLLDFGFSHFKGVPVIEKGALVDNLTVDKGCPSKVDLLAANKLGLLLPRGAEEEEYRQEIKMIAFELPLDRGQKIGELVVTYGDEQKVAVDLVASEPISPASLPTLFLRLTDRWLRFGR